MSNYLVLIDNIATRVLDLAKSHQEGRVAGIATIVAINFTESHFRALIKHLPCQEGDCRFVVNRGRSKPKNTINVPVVLEHQALKQQAITLRKMGWTQQKIADQVGIPQQTLSDWFTDNDMRSIIGKRRYSTDNTKAANVGKPQFLSWCGKLEDFSPENDIKFTILTYIGVIKFLRALMQKMPIKAGFTFKAQRYECRSCQHVFWVPYTVRTVSSSTERLSLSKLPKGKDFPIGLIMAKLSLQNGVQR